MLASVGCYATFGAPGPFAHPSQGGRAGPIPNHVPRAQGRRHWTRLVFLGPTVGCRRSWRELMVHHPSPTRVGGRSRHPCGDRGSRHKPLPTQDPTRVGFRTRGYWHLHARTRGHTGGSAEVPRISVGPRARSAWGTQTGWLLTWSHAALTTGSGEGGIPNHRPSSWTPEPHAWQRSFQLPARHTVRASHRGTLRRPVGGDAPNHRLPRVTPGPHAWQRSFQLPVRHTVRASHCVTLRKPVEGDAPNHRLSRETPGPRARHRFSPLPTCHAVRASHCVTPWKLVEGDAPNHRPPRGTPGSRAWPRPPLPPACHMVEGAFHQMTPGGKARRRRPQSPRARARQVLACNRVRTGAEVSCLNQAVHGPFAGYVCGADAAPSTLGNQSALKLLMAGTLPLRHCYLVALCVRHSTAAGSGFSLGHGFTGNYLFPWRWLCATPLLGPSGFTANPPTPLHCTRGAHGISSKR